VRRCINRILLAMALLLYFPMQAAAGTITGVVKVNGLRSPADILVFLTHAPAPVLDLPRAHFVMDQRNLTFLPHILPIPVGATVDFPNHDQVAHNVFSLSRTKKFNLGSYKPGMSKSVRFDKPGIVELRCDVHAEMRAYILVMKNPYFAVTDARGRFEIPDPALFQKLGLTKGLAAGKYAVKTWHEKLKSKKQVVTVPAQGALSVQLAVKRGRPGVLYK